MFPERGIVQWRRSEIEERLELGQESQEYFVRLCNCGIQCRLSGGGEADGLQLRRKLGKEGYGPLVQNLCSSCPKTRVAASGVFSDSWTEIHGRCSLQEARCVKLWSQRHRVCKWNQAVAGTIAVYALYLAWTSNATASIGSKRKV